MWLSVMWQAAGVMARAGGGRCSSVVSLGGVHRSSLAMVSLSSCLVANGPRLCSMPISRPQFSADVQHRFAAVKPHSAIRLISSFGSARISRAPKSLSIVVSDSASSSAWRLVRKNSFWSPISSRMSNIVFTLISS